jgi:acylphosphatase
LQKGKLMVQTNWTSLGQPGGTSYLLNPYVLQNADGRLEVLLNGSDGNFWHIWQTVPGKEWSTWVSLGTPTTKDFFPPIAARNADGRIEAFTVGYDGALWHIWQTAPGNGWSTWFSSGRPSSSIGLAAGSYCVESNQDGRLEVFALGSDDALWHIWQTAPNGPWSNWTSLEKPPNSDAIALGSGTNADGRIEVFTVASDGNLWHIWQTAPDESWSTWNSLGRPDSQNAGGFMPFTVSRNADGRLEVFVIGSDGAFYHIWQHTPGGSWGVWFWLDHPPSASFVDYAGSVAQNKDGHLEFLASASDEALWHIWQTAGGKDWGMWYSLGTPAGTRIINANPFVIANADGRLEAFITTTDGALWHTWQVTPGGEWGS